MDLENSDSPFLLSEFGHIGTSVTDNRRQPTLHAACMQHRTPDVVRFIRLVRRHWAIVKVNLKSLPNSDHESSYSAGSKLLVSLLPERADSVGHRTNRLAACLVVQF